jgi:hypothetical protein
MTARERYVYEYDTRLREWADTMTAHDVLFHGWSIDRLWQLIARLNQRIPIRTRHFFDAWSEIALHRRHAVHENEAARALIRKRERELKGSLARLENRRALENWGGASSTGRLDYRWGNVSRMLIDIQAGLRRRPTFDA